MSVTSHTTQEDQLNLFGIFPAEVWVLILDNVRDEQSYHYISGASPYFKSVLWPSRNKILFPFVAKVLRRQWRVLFSVSSLRPYQKLRKVCVDWRRNVDAFLQDEVHHDLEFTSEYIPSYYIRNFSRSGSASFDNSEDIQRFLDHFKQTHFKTMCNTLMFRSVSVDIEIEDENDAIVNKLKEFTFTYGEHVWFLNLTIRITDPVVEVRFVGIFRQLLEDLPNLRKLSVCYRNDFRLERVQTDAMQSYLCSNPMPKLKFLKIFMGSCLPFPVYKNLLERNMGTISQLEIQRINETTDLSRLSTLFVTPYINKEFEFFENQVRNCSITKLDIDMTWLPRRYNGVDRLFKLLEDQLSATLVELCLVLPSIRQQPVPDRLYLEKLQHLHLEMKDYVSLDFLLPMAKTIEVLNIDVGSVRAGMVPENVHECDKAVQFYKFQGELQKSNIWTWFPNMRRVFCRWPGTPNNPLGTTEYCTWKNLKEYPVHCYLGHLPV